MDEEKILTFKPSAILFLFLATVIGLFFSSIILFFLLLFPLIGTSATYILIIITALIGGLLSYKSLERFTLSGSLLILSGSTIPSLITFFIYLYFGILEIISSKIKSLASSIPFDLGIPAILDFFPKAIPSKLLLTILFFILFNISFIYFIIKGNFKKLVFLWYILGILINLLFILFATLIITTLSSFSI